MVCNIYCITNLINNKKYVGLTTRTIQRRFLEHCHSNDRHMLIVSALKKYGRKSFKIESLEVCESLDIANEREDYWIKFFNTQNRKVGYNITGGGLVRKHTPESIEKDRASLSGENNPWFGKHLTDEHRKNISNSKKGKTSPRKGVPCPNGRHPHKKHVLQEV